jgi:lipoate-protein ligase B
MNTLFVVNIGRTRYADAWELQKKVFNARREHRIPDVLLLTEHEHVYTFGKGADENHLLADAVELQEKNVEVYHIDRGGDITYHGPGQIVGYPILDLNLYYLDIHKYLRDLEGVIINTLSHFGVESKQLRDYTGVWVNDEKIAAIGVKVSRWITMHGFALNVNTDLHYFERIIPCGIFHKGLTSLSVLLQKEIDITEVQKILVHNFEGVFKVVAKTLSMEELFELIGTSVSSVISEIN